VAVLGWDVVQVVAENHVPPSLKRARAAIGIGEPFRVFPPIYVRLGGRYHFLLVDLLFGTFIAIAVGRSRSWRSW
jgi:hypothetical protein